MSIHTHPEHTVMRPLRKIHAELQPKRSAYCEPFKVYRSLEEAREEASRKEAETEATKERVKVLEDKVNPTNTNCPICPIACICVFEVLFCLSFRRTWKAYRTRQVLTFGVSEFRLRVAEDPHNLCSMSG